MTDLLIYEAQGGALLRQQPDGAWQFHCPVCHVWAYIDDDQFHGRVSVDHTDVQSFEGNCTYHETHDFAAMVGRAS